MALRAFRESRGLTQQQLAGELGLRSKAHVSCIETGVWPCTLPLALRIEAFSGGEVSALELLTGERRALLEAAIEREIARRAQRRGA